MGADTLGAADTGGGPDGGVLDAIGVGGSKDTTTLDTSGDPDGGTEPADVVGPVEDVPEPVDAVTVQDVAVIPDAAPVLDVPSPPDDTGEPACPPNPFVAPGPAEGWDHTTTELFIVTQGSANHRGQDVVARVGEPQVLIGKFAYGVFDKDLKDERVEVFIQDDPPCGPWTSLGSDLTSEDGEFGTQYGVEDDGGRIFFTIPVEDERPVGRYPVRMLAHGDNSVAAFTLYVVEDGTTSVVFDIDGTLTTADFELIKELFADIFSGAYVPDMYEGAVDVVNVWADKGYLVVYLTGRPDMLRSASQGWLQDLGFPEGAVHLTDTTTQALPTSGGVAKYKTDFLDKLKGQGVELFAAYGNASTDIEGYENAAVPKERTFIIGKNAGASGTVGIASYPEHLPAAQAMPVAVVAAPPESGVW